jgi:glutamine amidotransferase
MLVIIDYGMGNLQSIYKSFKRLNIEATVTGDKQKILNADKLILPGVGHFKQGMKNLEEKGLVDILREKVLAKRTPILGICLGMQLFTDHSEEGNVDGLALIKAKTIRFKFDNHNERIKIPHIGWNSVKTVKESPVFENVPDDSSFYFVHSFYVNCENKGNILAETKYGNVFHSAFIKDKIIGLQFHPEKSHKAGLKLLENFIKKF